MTNPKVLRKIIFNHSLSNRIHRRKKVTPSFKKKRREKHPTVKVSILADVIVNHSGVNLSALGVYWPIKQGGLLILKIDRIEEISGWRIIVSINALALRLRIRSTRQEIELRLSHRLGYSSFRDLYVSN